MGETGLLGPDARVELLDGEILEMPEIGGPHLACVNRLNRLLVGFAEGLSGERYVVSVQNPLVIGDDGVPLPDLVLLRPREDFYADPPPRAEDVLLLIEVSASSLRFDREVKLPRYASGATGVPEVWIVNLVAEEVELHVGPRRDARWDAEGEDAGAGTGPSTSSGTYATKKTSVRGERVLSESVGGLSVAVDEVIGLRS